MSTNRSKVFKNLENKFGDWLKSLKKSDSGAMDHYVSNLKAIADPIAPHSSPTGKWHGFFELLTGNRPSKGIYEVTSVREFSSIFGIAIPFFTLDSSANKELVRPLYPQCVNFDELIKFAYDHGTKTSPGDGGHTRNGFVKYCQFICYLESKLAGDDHELELTNLEAPLQRIFYGAPGTGKSKGVDKTTVQLPREDVVRTTFHPDSDYSTFVGAYKPKMDEVPRTMMKGEKIEKITQGETELLVEKKISYEFVPQAFAKAYVQAWKRMAAPVDGKTLPVMLVIEEINRGDCAKVFGDLFQLLDRRVKDDELHLGDATKRAGFSEYPVLADSDLADYIRRSLKNEKAAIENAGYGLVVADENLQLVLPPNLYIWATMNTSDQSLFPMDSAFKRRWEWKYVPIKNEKLGWKIVVGKDGAKKNFDWWDFLHNVNDVVEEVTSSEDKKLGYFFVKTADGTIDEDALVNKVFFFLWNDVFKDVAGEPRLQFDEDGKSKDLKFHHFFKPDDGKIDTDRVIAFLEKNLKLGAPEGAVGSEVHGNEV